MTPARVDSCARCDPNIGGVLEIGVDTPDEDVPFNGDVEVGEAEDGPVKPDEPVGVAFPLCTGAPPDAAVPVTEALPDAALPRDASPESASDAGPVLLNGDPTPFIGGSFIGMPLDGTTEFPDVGPASQPFDS